MGILDLFRSKRVAAPAPAKRAYAGAHLSRMTSFQISSEAAHQTLKRDLLGLRHHSRDLCQNNVYARRYVSIIANNIVGSNGITLESDILGKDKRPVQAWNEAIEEQWRLWAHTVSADGRSNLVAFQEQVMQTVAMDGEAFVHVMRGFPNRWGLALEMIDADRVDWAWNEPVNPRTGERTVMGVRLDANFKRLGYYVWSAHPQDWEAQPKREFIPAAEIIHVFAEDRARSVRGIPFLTPVMVNLDMLGRLLTAELANANAMSDILGIIKGPAPDPDADDAAVNAGTPPEMLSAPYLTANTLQAEMGSEHATWLGLDSGQDVVFPQAVHPNPHLQEFAKMLLKGIASGLSVAYHRLSGDVADANYSASRVAAMDELAEIERLQKFFIRQFCDPIFRIWLEMAVLSGAVKIPVANWEQLAAPKWWGPVPDAIDPIKEDTAAILRIRSGLSTYQHELGHRNFNWRAAFRQRAEEQAYQTELGLNLELDNGKANANAPSDPGNSKDVAAAPAADTKAEGQGEKPGTEIKGGAK